MSNKKLSRWYKHVLSGYEIAKEKKRKKYISMITSLKEQQIR